ncbi:hypothetical protein GCM10010420_16490 [Streptomyces glaucosporus]|uniref:Uncharacterized protein n=1 Tax=Streptomyces glaucosporus TaxID=284044 RepID=A0ABN3I183_9ACTN
MPLQPPGPGNDRNEPGGEPAVPDEVWERFVEECASGRSAPEEPSARARMVTARLRQQDEEAARRGPLRNRLRGRRPEPRRPEGWRTGPAWQETEGGRRGSGGLGRVGMGVGAVAAALALLYALNPPLVRSWMPGGDDGAAPAPLPAETARPAEAPEAEALPDRPTVEEPFAGSPARRWADGADAIELPRAEAAGGVPAAAIEAALERTKRFLVAANLDPDVLRGAEPTEALDLMDPLMGDFVTDARTSLEKPGEENDPTALFTRFDRDEVGLAGEVVKVRGRMELTKGQKGVPRIHADYTFVYPFVRAGGGDEVARTIVRRTLDVDVLHGPEWKYTEGKLWIYSTDVYIANGGCGEHDGFVHPQFTEDLHAGPVPSGPEKDPYDRSESIEDLGEDGECGVVSRT